MKVMSHGDICEIENDVFWLQGTIMMGPGVRINRNMVIVRSGQDLTIISALRLSPAGHQQLDRLGTVRHVIKLAYAHGVDDQYFLDHYQAKYWALPDGARQRDPVPDELLSSDHLPIADAKLFAFSETTKPEAALLIQRGQGLLVSGDSIQHWPNTKGCSLVARGLVHAIGFRRRCIQIGPPWRKHMTPQGGSLEQDFTRMAKLEFQHMVGAHGAPLMNSANSELLATIAATYRS